MKCEADNIEGEADLDIKSEADLDIKCEADHIEGEADLDIKCEADPD